MKGPIFVVAWLAAVVVSTLWAQSEGTLEVRTTPEGIEVWLSDKYIGDSPIFDKKVKPGRYILKLIDPVQHVSSTEEILIQPGEKTVIEKTIKGKFGSLRVDSDPPGAHVSIATPLGKTPLINDFMNPGRYHLEIRYPGRRYEPTMQEVVIPRGESVSISKTLVRKKILDNKAMLRLALGAGAIGTAVWAIYEEAQRWKNETQASEATGSERRKYLDRRNSAIAWRTVAAAASCLCVVGFEIVAFF